MPQIITVADLRAALGGVDSSLFNDTYMERVINTAEGVILPKLVANTSSVEAVKLVSNVATYYTQSEHYFVAGQSIVVSGLRSPFSATVTVVDAGKFWFTASVTASDVAYQRTIPAGVASLSGYSAAEIYANNAVVEEAVLVVSIEVFQSITAAGGQIEGLDFSPTPYRMGRSLENRVAGLIGIYYDAGAVIG